MNTQHNACFQESCYACIFGVRQSPAALPAAQFFKRISTLVSLICITLLLLLISPSALAAPDDSWDGRFGTLGVNGEVRAIAVGETNIYVGGYSQLPVPRQTTPSRGGTACNGTHSAMASTDMSRPLPWPAMELSM